MSIVPASDKLTARLRANWQRRQRELLIESLPKKLATLLKDASVITDPDRVQFTQFFCITPDGAGSGSKLKPKGYEFFDTGLRSRVTEFLQFKVPGLGSGRAILAFEDDDLPCFRVPFEDAETQFFEFLAFAKHGVLLVAEDLSFGAVVSTHGGYHSEEREAAEITFEVATWSRPDGK